MSHKIGVHFRLGTVRRPLDLFQQLNDFAAFLLNNYICLERKLDDHQCPDHEAQVEKFGCKYEVLFGSS